MISDNQRDEMAELWSRHLIRSLDATAAFVHTAHELYHEVFDGSDKQGHERMMMTIMHEVIVEADLGTALYRMYREAHKDDIDTLVLGCMLSALTPTIKRLDAVAKSFLFEGGDKWLEGKPQQQTWHKASEQYATMQDELKATANIGQAIEAVFDRDDPCNN